MIQTLFSDSILPVSRIFPAIDNGNIITYKRNGDAARSNAAIKGMDDLVYHYAPHTNQLDYVAESAPDALPEEYEKYRDIQQGQASGNYQYDAIGNLTKDASEGITHIEWNVYGKIKSITKSGTSISYTYDATGNRISKTVNGKSTYYVRDAQGNILSIYEKEDTLKQTEINLYGSSRLGIYPIEKNESFLKNCLSKFNCTRPPIQRKQKSSGTAIHAYGKKETVCPLPRMNQSLERRFVAVPQAFAYGRA